MRPRSDDRQGCNNCISGRIPDNIDELIDIIVKKEGISRSRIVYEALSQYIENKTQGNFIIEDYIRENLKTNEFFIIKRDENEDDMLVGSVRGHYVKGKTISELIANLKESMEVSLGL